MHPLLLLLLFGFTVAVCTGVTIMPFVTSSGKVRVVATSSPLNYSYVQGTSWANMTLLDYVTSNLQTAVPGITVTFGEHIYSAWYYLAGTDAQRADDFMKAWEDPTITWIFTARGGWGLHRLLPFVNWTTIKNNPKVYTGYSDVTTMLFCLYTKAGLRGYNAPMSTDDWGGHESFNHPFSHWNMYYVSHILAGNERLTLSVPSGYVSQTSGGPYTITPGKATGLFVGGHLRQITGLLGTEYIPDGFFQGKILFIDLVSRMPCELDLLLAQLKTAGVLNQLAGVIWGDSYSGVKSTGQVGPDPSIRTIVESYIKPLGVPAFGSAFFGHTTDTGQWLIPFGINAEMDADAFTITFLEDPMDPVVKRSTTVDDGITTSIERRSVAADATIIIPPAITLASKVAVVSLSSPVAYQYKQGSEWRTQSVVDHVTTAVQQIVPGINVIFGTHFNSSWYYLAGTDAQRVADFHAAWADNTVGWIVASRGGWGSGRLLPLIDWPLVKSNPKVFSGYGDVTSLLFALYVKTGIRGVYGPMATDDWGNHESYGRTFAHWNSYYMQKILVDNEQLTLSIPTGYVSPTTGAPWTITPGKATGQLVGGDLRQITALFGTEYLPAGFFQGKILILEMAFRMPRELDFCLAELRAAGILNQLAGVIWGDCYNCTASNGHIGPDPSIKDLVESYVKPLGVPAFGGAFFGSTPDNGQWAFPFGINVEMDADALTITFLETPYVSAASMTTISIAVISFIIALVSLL